MFFPMLTIKLGIVSENYSPKYKVKLFKLGNFNKHLAKEIAPSFVTFKQLDSKLKDRFKNTL